MGMTIKDIARKVGVSTTTVSRVLNNKPDVSEETRKKIEKIIDKYNYNPNDIARGLVLKQTKTIGLIIPDISNPYFPEVIKGVEQKSKNAGYSVIICDTENQIEQEMSSIDLMLGKQVDGIIISPSIEVKGEYEKLNKFDVPIIQLDREIPDLDFSVVSVDNQSSAYRAVEFLIKKGHRRIGHVTGVMRTHTAQKRLEGYKIALADNNIKFTDEFIRKGDFTKESGYNAVKDLLKKEMPTAIFFANDLMAIGAYEALAEDNIKVPDDVSIIGHDDIDIASLIKPSLTTMRQPKKELGKIAAENLINKIEKRGEEKKVFLETELIKRESTGCKLF